MTGMTVLSFRRVRRRPALHRRATPTGSLSLIDVHDLIYIANITVGGSTYPVQLDTGSSDLWILGSHPTAESTSTQLNLTYGIGSVQGQIAFASAEFAGISVSRQAYLNVSSAQNPAISYGAAGIWGLGFMSLSHINTAISKSGSSDGKSLLYNLFGDNPKQPNFIAFSLNGISNTDNVQGIFSVGETDPSYANVTSTNKIPTWPIAKPVYWTVLLDSFLVGSVTHSVSSTVATAPPNKAVVLLDSGTSYTYAPTEVCTAIYGGLSGARYDSTLGQWIVPCDAEIDMALQINNQIFPIHPLDVTPTALGDPNTCVGSFVPQNVSVGAGQFDIVLGTNALRSIYTLYDFGDFDSSGNMGNPYVQMLALIDPLQASIEFHDARGGTPNTNITYNVSDSGSESTTVTLSTDVATALETLSKFLPAILGIVALNALVLILLAVAGTILLCRRRGKNVRPRKNPGRLAPTSMGNPYGSRNSELPENVPHTYQPVSVALTEDTLFVPPTPGFKNDTSRYGDRPNSVA